MHVTMSTAMTLFDHTQGMHIADLNGEDARFKVGEWHVDVSARQVTNGQILRSLSPRAMGVLVCLARAEGRVVTRDTLLASVWPDVTVGDESLTQAVAELRKVFRTKRTVSGIVGTVPKRGYRLLVPVEAQNAALDLADDCVPAISMEAYALVLEAKNAWVRAEPNAAAHAVALCREAAAISPRAAVAQAQLSIALAHFGLYGGGSNDDLVDALDAAVQAVQWGPDAPLAHAAHGFALSVLSRTDVSEIAFARCFELGDADGEGHYLAARASFAEGRYRSAASLALKSADLVADVPRPLFLAARAAKRIDPVLGCRIAHSCCRHLDQRLSTDPHELRSRYTMGPALALASERDPAHEWLAQSLDGGSVCGIHNVFGYASIDNVDAGLNSLEEAIDGGYRDLRWLMREPMVERLKDQPRFEQLTRTLQAA